MKYSRLFYSSALAMVLILSSGCLGQRDRTPISKQKLKGSGRVYLVPLGAFSDATVRHLASYFRDRYGLQVETLAHVVLPPESMNPGRQQLIAEAAVEIMKQAFPDLTKDPEAIMIGLTKEDMYIAQKNWRYSFSWRVQGKYAVVSTGRMDFSLGRQPLSKDQVRTRLRKMVTKNVGLLYYDLAPSDDPRSVLYRNVGGVEELDYMGEEF